MILIFIKEKQFIISVYKLGNVTSINYFTTFLQTVVVTNSYWFSFVSTTNITFSLTNNH